MSHDNSLIIMITKELIFPEEFVPYVKVKVLSAAACKGESYRPSTI